VFFKVASHRVLLRSPSLLRNFARTRMDGVECGWYLRGVYFATAFVLGVFGGGGGDFFPFSSLSLYGVEKKIGFLSGGEGAMRR